MSQTVQFPMLLESFFTKRLIAQRRASPQTIASYRDTFRLLLKFAHTELGKSASQIAMEDLNATFVGAFLDNLEGNRSNSVRSRNLRMTVIRSFFRYAVMEAPQYSGLVQRVLAMPSKRQDRRLVGFLSRAEIDALLSAPNRNCWLGRRDYALPLLPLQTGLRLSEIATLRQQDVVLAGAPIFNLESRKLRYVMRDRLCSLGWSDIEVIDEGPTRIRHRDEGGLGRLGCRSMLGPRYSSSAKHWTRRTSDDSVRVRSQPAQPFMQDAATDYHQVGRVTLGFFSNSLCDVAYGHAQWPFKPCLLLQGLDRLVSFRPRVLLRFPIVFARRPHREARDDVHQAYCRFDFVG